MESAKSLVRRNLALAGVLAIGVPGAIVAGPARSYYTPTIASMQVVRVGPVGFPWNRYDVSAGGKARFALQVTLTDDTTTVVTSNDGTITWSVRRGSCLGGKYTAPANTRHPVTSDQLNVRFAPKKGGYEFKSGTPDSIDAVLVITQPAPTAQPRIPKPES